MDRIIEKFQAILPDALVLFSLMVFAWSREKRRKKALRKEVSLKLPTKEGYIAYINKRPYHFIDILAGEKIHKEEFYKVDDSDLYFQEYPEEREIEEKDCSEERVRKTI